MWLPKYSLTGVVSRYVVTVVRQNPEKFAELVARIGLPACLGFQAAALMTLMLVQRQRGIGTTGEVEEATQTVQGNRSRKRNAIEVSSRTCGEPEDQVTRVVLPMKRRRRLAGLPIFEHVQVMIRQDVKFFLGKGIALLKKQCEEKNCFKYRLFANADSMEGFREVPVSYSWDSLGCLEDEQGWLHGDVINLFLIHLSKILELPPTIAVVCSTWDKYSNFHFQRGIRYLLPLHVSDTHWLACDVDTDQNRLTLYDSLPPAHGKIGSKEECQMLKQRIRTDLKHKISVEENPSCTKNQLQQGHYECGVFALAFLHALMANVPVTSITHHEVAFYRVFILSVLISGGSKDLLYDFYDFNDQ